MAVSGPEIEAEGPLTLQQEEMLGSMRAFPAFSAAYSVVFLYRLDGDLDRDSFARAWADLAALHPSLRTVVNEAEGRQRVLREWPGYSSVDVSEAELAQLGASLVRRLPTAEATAGGELMFRVQLFRAGSRTMLGLYVHHLVCDVRSLDLLWENFRELYAARVEGRRSAQAGEPTSCVEIAHQQRDAWREEGERAVAFWRRQLEGWQTRVTWPSSDFEDGADQVAVQRIELPPEAIEGVRAVSQAAGVTPFTVLLATTAAAVHRITGHRDLLLGNDSRDRLAEARQAVVGHLVNTRLTLARPQPGQDLVALARSIADFRRSASSYRKIYADQLLAALDRPAVLKVNLVTGRGAVWDSIDLHGVTAVRQPIEDPREASGIPGASTAPSRRDIGLFWIGDGSTYGLTVLHRTSVLAPATANALGAEATSFLKDPTRPI